MIRISLGMTALATLLATGAIAEDATPVSPPVAATTGNAAAASDQMLATAILGKTVYTGTDEEGEAIGNVKDVVIGADGSAQAIVIGVGGFLGLGEKDVAINFDRVSWSDKDGKRIIVVSATKEDLQAAPAFERKPIMDGAVTKDAQPSLKTSKAETPVITDENAETEIPATGTTPAMTDPDAAPADGIASASAMPAPELVPIDPSMISAEKLIGTQVKVADDTRVGEIGDVILGSDRKIEAYVIDVGGFLGIGAKPVAMSAQSLEVMADASGTMTIFSPFTKEQLEKQPAYDAAAYKANPRSILLSTPGQ